MFGLMKNLLKEKQPVSTVKLADLHVGCVVGFGFMPQKNIRGCRLPVTEVNSYLFDNDSFLAYRLEYEDTSVNMIVADGEESAGAYLALSQPIKPLWFSPLFVDSLPELWFAMQEGESIDVAARTLGAPSGWLAQRYTLVMATEGRLLEGDYRLRKSSDRFRLSQKFDYVLLVDEANNYALEAEKYEDGTLHVYATVYRPVTDIGEMTRLQRPNMPLPAPEAAPLPQMELVQDIEVHELPVAQEILPLVEAVDIAPMHGKFGRIQPMNPPAQSFAPPDVLACGTQLAARIIDEAQRNQLLLSELIRKVIDLPARIQEEILIPFSLQDHEYAELARRYDLSPSDREGVRNQILEELRQFVGEKK